MSDSQPIFALFQGIFQASSQIGTSPQQMQLLIRSLDFQNSLFFQKVKSVIIEQGMKHTPRIAARKFGISEKLVISIMKQYLTQTVHKENNTWYPFNSFDKFSQTTLPHISRQKSVMSQTSPLGLPQKMSKDLEEKERKIHKQYSIMEKIRAVKEFLKHETKAAASRELDIPAASLIRWKDKIKYSAFQDHHYQLFYSDPVNPKRDTILTQLEYELHKIYNEKKEEITGSVDDFLVQTAKSLIQVDEKIPKISQKWLLGFKKSFNIN